MQEVVITTKTLCSFSMLWRPKLYLGHIKSNSLTVTQCYVNCSNNSLKHCTVAKWWEQITTKCLHHLNDLGLLAAMTSIYSQVLAQTFRLQDLFHCMSPQT